MRQSLFTEQAGKPAVHHAVRLLDRQRHRVEPRILFMAVGGRAQHAQDEPALVEAVVDAVRAQVVLNADVGRVPLFQRAGFGPERVQGFQR